MYFKNYHIKIVLLDHEKKEPTKIFVGVFNLFGYDIFSVESWVTIMIYHSAPSKLIQESILTRIWMYQ